MHKNMPATTWQAWVHVFNYFTCLLDRGGSCIEPSFYYIDYGIIEETKEGHQYEI